MRLAINGFGRIGKTFLRTIMEDPSALNVLNVVTINIGPACIDHIGLLFKYDTIMGNYAGSVEQQEHELIIDGHAIEILQECDPSDIDWHKRGIDWVVECSGQFTKRKEAEKHIKSGAKAVLISAPAQDEDQSIVPGVNDILFKKDKDTIVSLGSCTTNAAMTMLKVLQQDCGLQQAFMTTVHAYTNSQALLDSNFKDPRRSRAAALNIVPTKTGAAKMVDKIIPALKGRVTATAIRVPVGIVSYLVITFESSERLTDSMINNAFLNAAAGSLKGILDITMEPLVSSDFIGSPYAAVVDGVSTQASGRMASVSGWYDNEWGYSVRMKEFLLSVEK